MKSIRMRKLAMAAGLLIVVLAGIFYQRQRRMKNAAQQNRPVRPSIEISSGGGARSLATPALNENAFTPVASRTLTPGGPPRRGTISGLVHDEQRQPIAGAQVTLLQPPSAANRLQAPLPGQVASDAQGRYTLENIVYRGTVTLSLSAQAPGYARLVTSLHTLDDTRTSTAIDLLLSPGLTFKVKVVNTEQEPLAGALVRVNNPPEKEWHGPALVSEGVCAADGICIFADQSPGALAVYAQAEGFVPHQVVFALEPAAAANEEPLVIELAEGRSLAGRTIDELEEPLAGVRITLQDLGPTRSANQTAAWETTSDREGYWRIDLLRSVQYLLTATYSPAADNQMVYRRHLPAIQPPQEELEIVFSLGGRIQAQVIDQETELPLHDVLVSLELLNPARAGGARAATRIAPAVQHFATESGEITIDALPTGVYRLRLNAPGHRQATLSSISVTSPETTDLGVVAMSGGAGIMGRIIARDDLSPLAGAAVILRGSGFIKRQDSNAQGQFQFLDLLPGNFDLTCTHRDFLEGRVNDIYFAGGELVELNDLLLDRGGAIRGTVTDRQGRPLPEVRVRIDVVEQFADGGEAPQPKQAITDTAGRFSLIGLKPALYLVSCTLRIVEPTGNKGNFAYQEVDITERPEAEVRLVLEQNAKLFVTLSTEDQSPLINSLVTGYSLLPLAAEDYMAFNRHPGQANELSLTALSPGDYLILASGDLAAGRTLRLGQRVVLAAEDNRIDFLFANHERSGLVTIGDTEDPLPDCSVSFRMIIPGYEPDLNQSWLLTTSVQTNAEGRFTIRGLQNQSYLISIRPQGAARRLDIATINIQNTSPGKIIEIRAPDRLSKR